MRTCHMCTPISLYLPTCYKPDAYNLPGTLALHWPDMEKFPVRMKDNDILVTQLFEDPFKEPITALGIYLTPNVCKCLATSIEGCRR